MAYKYQLGAATLSGSLTQEGSVTVKDDSGTTKAVVDITGVISGPSHLESGGNLTVAGTIKFEGASDTAIAVASDSIYFRDADGSMKRDTVADIMTAVAGDGLAASSGVLAVGVDDSTIETNSDALRIKDSGVTGAKLNNDVISAQTNLGGTGVDDADEFLFSDAGTIKALTGANLYGWVFSKVSGDATVAAGGALTIANDAVETAMLNDNVISGQSELAQGGLAAADEFLISDGGTLKRYGVDSFAKDALALTTEAAIADGDYITFLDGGATGETKKESLADLATLFAGDGLTAASSVLSVAASGSVHITSDKVAISGSVAGTGLGFLGPAVAIEGLELDLNELSAAAVNVGADSIAIIDADDSNVSKKESIADLMTAAAGAGLAAASGVLSVDIDELGAGTTLHQTEDHFMFSDDGTEKKITFSDLQDSVFADVSGDATIAAGGALTIGAGAVEHGMLAEDIISGQDELAHADIADADELMISDAGTIKRVGVDSIRDHFFGVVSGDATVADGGALTIANDAVESGMLNDNVISGQTELASDGLAAADELMISDGGTLKKIGVDNLMKDGPGLLSAAAVDVSADHFMFLDGGATGDAKIESVADLVTGMAGAGLTATSGVLSVTGNNVALKADGNALVEGYNYFADASANATVTMPASPSVGDVVTAKAGNLTSGATIIINKGSADHRIDGLEGIVIESPFGAVTMVYVVADHWKIV